MAVSEQGRMTGFATDPAARVERERLAREKGPSAAASSGNWVDWGAMAELLGQPFDTTSIPISKLEQMRRDPMIAFGLAFVKLPLIRAPWYIKSTDAQRAAFIDNALRRIYGRLILGYANCLDYGYSGLVRKFEMLDPDWMYIDKDTPEELEKRVWDEGTKAVVWKPFMSLNPRRCKPAWSTSGDFNGIYYDRGSKSGATFDFSTKGPDPDIPLEWALWATNEKDSVFGSYWGYPRTGYSYRYWWAYWYRFGLADRAFEKWADPPVEVYHPTDAGLAPDGSRVNFTAEALALAEKLRSGANVALPSDVIETLDGRVTTVRKWEVRQQESKTNFDALNQAFEYLDVQKIRALMVPEQALVEGRGGTSSRNVASEMGDLLQQSQAMIMEEIDDLINRYMIPQLLEANFGQGGASCTKVTTGFDPQDIDTMRAIIQVVGQSMPAKLPVDFRELLDRLGIPVLSSKRIQAELDEQAKAAAESAPPATGAVPSTAGGTPGQAGVTPQGFYYDARERIELAGPSPYIVERVETLPTDVAGAAAYFDQEKMTLYILKDAPIEAFREYLLSLSERGPIAVKGSGIDDEVAGILLERMERLEQMGIDRQVPDIYVDITVPDAREEDENGEA